MARTYLIFGEIEGKLDVLCVECTKCARKGRYSVRPTISNIAAIAGPHGGSHNDPKPNWLYRTTPRPKCVLRDNWDIGDCDVVSRLGRGT
jgi:hypothetical protein